MRGTMVVLKADGTTETVFLERAAQLARDLQRRVGGYIEGVPGYNHHIVEGVPMPAAMFCNEEGKLRDLPVNELATALWHTQWRTRDVLVGDVVVIYGDEEFMASL